MYLTNHGLAQLLGKVCLGLLGTAHDGDQTGFKVTRHLHARLNKEHRVKDTHTHLRLDDVDKLLRAELAVLVADSWMVKY